MKIIAAFCLIFVIGKCSGQTNPMAWSRTRSQNPEASNEVLVNSDRLMSSIETRITSIVRSETNSLRQQINRLEQSRSENGIGEIKNVIDELKTLMESIRDSDHDLSASEKEKSNDGDISQKLDNLSLVVTAIRNTIGKLERDVVVVKKNIRNGARNASPFALIPTQSEIGNEHGACSANDPNTESGVRRIRKDFFAFCEMEAEESGGWIIIQRRLNGKTDFFRQWNEYKEGFGNIAGEFWMGLEKIYELTSSRLHELMIVMESFDGTKKTAKYSAFGISGESSFYSLSLLGAFSGNAGDSLKYHAGMKFSTFDNDNDAWMDGNCARSHLGGWWYNSCDESNLNGRYFRDEEIEPANKYQGIFWNEVTGSLGSLKSVKMMIRPAEF